MSLITVFKNLFRNNTNTLTSDANTITTSPVNKVSLPHKAISHNALKIIKRLNKAGYEAYLVGGGVRDLLLDLKPKDFDIATNATPEQIRKLFRNCRLIGRRFRLAHVYFPNEIIEVSTFRAANNDKENQHKCADSGMILRDNNYGNQEEDAWRRDFTLNALYYDPECEHILDVTNGLLDIEKRQIQIIGDATTRYREDPVRMLRAIRFLAKLDFKIENNTAAPFTELHKLLWNVPPSRLFEEVLKLFFSGHAIASYRELRQHDFFTLLFPQISTFIESENFTTLLDIALQNTDTRFGSGKSINPAFLLAVILWPPLQEEIQKQPREQPAFIAQQNAMHAVIQQQLKTLAIPKRLTQMIREIWDLQPRLTKRYGKRAFKTLAQPRFRAAYDFLLLRANIEPQLKPLVDWWTDFQVANPQQQNEMLANLPRQRKKRKR